MKVRHEPLRVQCYAGLPDQIARRRRIGRALRGRVTRVMDHQIVAGKWWQSPDLICEVRLYYLVEVHWQSGTTSTMEIYQQRDEWFLSRISD